MMRVCLWPKAGMAWCLHGVVLRVSCGPIGLEMVLRSMTFSSFNFTFGIFRRRGVGHLSTRVLIMILALLEAFVALRSIGEVSTARLRRERGFAEYTVMNLNEVASSLLSGSCILFHRLTWPLGLHNVAQMWLPWIPRHSGHLRCPSVLRYRRLLRLSIRLHLSEPTIRTVLRLSRAIGGSTLIHRSEGLREDLRRTLHCLVLHSSIKLSGSLSNRVPWVISLIIDIHFTFRVCPGS